MIRIALPGLPDLLISDLVLDYNGTLAVEGNPVSGVLDRLNRLSEKAVIHVVTADTFGTASAALSGESLTLTVLPPHNQADAKSEYVRKLGSDTVAALGNGRNDRKMFEEAGLSIALIQQEGAYLPAVKVADLVFTSINDALDSLLNPARITASLRT